MTRVIVAAMGAAGSGKTTFNNKLAAILEERGYNVIRPPSASREVYTKRGLTENNVAQMSPSDVLHLHYEIFDTLERQIVTFGTAERRSVLLMDRTLFDVIAYTIIHANAVITHDIIEALYNRAKGVYKDRAGVYVRFGFYAPWAYKDNDAYRMQSWGKDCVFAALLHGLDRRWANDDRTIGAIAVDNQVKDFRPIAYTEEDYSNDLEGKLIDVLYFVGRLMDGSIASQNV